MGGGVKLGFCVFPVPLVDSVCPGFDVRLSDGKDELDFDALGVKVNLPFELVLAITCTCTFFIFVGGIIICFNRKFIVGS